MRYINKLIYLLKDLSLWFFIFLLGFFLGSRMITAKAADEVILDYTNAFDYVKEKGLTFKHSNITVDFTEKLEELISVLDNNNIYYSVVINKIPYYGCKNNESYCFPDISIIQYKNDSVSLNFELSNLDSGYKLYPTLLSNEIIKYVSFRYPSVFTEEIFLSYFDNLIVYINENKSLPLSFDVGGWTGYTPSSSTYGLGSVIFDSDFNYSDSNSGVGGFLFYDSNVDHKIKNMSNFDGLKITDQIYKVNSNFSTYKSIYGKTVYSEDFRIDSKDIDRIEYTFEITENQLFMHEFNFSATWYSSIARADLFSPPFLEYKQNNISYKLPLDEHKNSTLDDVVYYDTQINPFRDIQELKFVVDFSNINNLTNKSEVLIHFDSSLNFTKKIIYANDIESSTNYYTEVDFSKKYGVYLIPKFLQNGNEQEVYSNVLYHAKGLKIDVFSNTDTSKAPVQTKYDYNNVGGLWGNFNYLFRFNNKNQMLFFTNKDYLTDTESTKIRYDTRYFIHSICDSEFKCTSVINPNTGEEISPKPPSDDESYNFNSVIKKIKEFINGLHTNLDSIAETIQYFYDNLPNMLKNFLIVIYSCFLLFALYLIIRR